eukprot:484115_1
MYVCCHSMVTATFIIVLITIHNMCNAIYEEVNVGDGDTIWLYHPHVSTNQPSSHPINNPTHNPTLLTHFPEKKHTKTVTTHPIKDTNLRSSARIINQQNNQRSNASQFNENKSSQTIRLIGLTNPNTTSLMHHLVIMNDVGYAAVITTFNDHRIDLCKLSHRYTIHDIVNVAFYSIWTLIIDLMDDIQHHMSSCSSENVIRTLVSELFTKIIYEYVKFEKLFFDCILEQLKHKPTPMHEVLDIANMIYDTFNNNSQYHEITCVKQEDMDIVFIKNMLTFIEVSIKHITDENIMRILPIIQCSKYSKSNKIPQRVRNNWNDIISASHKVSQLSWIDHVWSYLFSCKIDELKNIKLLKTQFQRLRSELYYLKIFCDIGRTVYDIQQANIHGEIAIIIKRQ